jgi:hypothetical protein
MPSPEEIAAAAATAFPPAPPEPEPAETAEPAVDGETPAETAAPSSITHDEPLLASGSAGAVVQRLAALLAVCGHADNTIGRGENPGGVLDQSVMADVRAFAQEHGVVEKLEDITGEIVGPATWQKLYDEAQRTLGL